LLNVTSKIWTKNIRPMVCALNNCFCHQKAKMNFTQSMGLAEGLYAITITLHIAQLCLPLSWNRSNTGLVYAWGGITSTRTPSGWGGAEFEWGDFRMGCFYCGCYVIRGLGNCVGIIPPLVSIILPTA